MEVKGINAYGVWAHDAVSALAMAVERTESVEQLLKSNVRGTTLLNQMLGISFHGLGGVFQFIYGRINAQAVEIVNIVGKGERRVGFSTTDVAFPQKIGKLNSFSDQGLEAVVWPGGITTNPTHRMLQMSSKSLRFGIPVQTRSGGLFQVDYDPQTNSTVASGFYVEVCEAAFAALSRDVAFQFIPFMLNSTVGTVNYNELIDRVHAREFDVAVGDITITANRSLYVDFMIPFTDFGLGTLSRKAHQDNKSEQPFGLPFLLLFMLIVTSCSAICQDLVVIMWLFVVLVLVSSYTAKLSSILTIEQIRLASKANLIGY